MFFNLILSHLVLGSQLWIIVSDFQVQSPYQAYMIVIQHKETSQLLCGVGYGYESICLWELWLNLLHCFSLLHALYITYVIWITVTGTVNISQLDNDGLGWPIAWPCLVDATELHVNSTPVSICSLSAQTWMMVTSDVYYSLRSILTSARSLIPQTKTLYESTRWVLTPCE
jgi:hypothetical protein